MPVGVQGRKVSVEEVRQEGAVCLDMVPHAINMGDNRWPQNPSST